MKKIITLLSLFVFSLVSGQKNIEGVLKKMNSESVPYIQVSELVAKTNVVLLDAREKEEYDVSHLKNAQFVGYKKYDEKIISDLVKTKDQLIVVYCSIGVRSENIGEKLQKMGYTNVYNLYGGIFEWKNQNNMVVDSTNQSTEKVHCFSKFWSKYLTKGEKVY